MNILRNAIVIGGLGLAASSSLASVRTIEMEIATSTFGGFQFSVIHTADSSGNQGGQIVARLSGSFSVQYDDGDTAGIGDDVVTFVSFNGDIAGTGRSQDIRLDTARGASSFSLDGSITPDGGHVVNGSLNLEVFEGSWQSLSYSFAPTDINQLANQFFIGGDPQDANSDFTIGLWGLADNTNGLFGHTGDLGIDLVGRGRIIPMPTPFALAGAGLLGVGLVTRRR